MALQEELEALKEPWDAVVVGGGITGAGVLSEASRRGLSCLLLEQKDFAWGTSSRSSKMVHGGLRYLKQGQFKTSWQSVRERERLLKEYPGLVQPLPFIFPVKKDRFVLKWGVNLFISFYDLMAGRKAHQFHKPEALSALMPGLGDGRSYGGFSFLDAVTDDARLVLRTIQEAERRGGRALNYIRVLDLLKDQKGRAAGVAVQDQRDQKTHEIMAGVVINATGAWADDLRACFGRPARLRRLRGSHLVFSQARFPLASAVALASPRDRRSLFALPWEGMTLLGTTDLDHEPPLEMEPRITRSEGEYLMEAATQWFPGLDLSSEDVVATFAGVRPVINTGKANPSRESREHAVWVEDGLVTISGGKLTTFRLMASQALQAARPWLKAGSLSSRGGPCAIRDFEREKIETAVAETDDAFRDRLACRYGPRAREIEAVLSGPLLETVEGTSTCWAELVWSASKEKVVHLDDLLLRRTRLGLLLPQGGAGILGRVRNCVQAALGWDDSRWELETDRYLTLWREAFSPDLLD
jgi:glycerol-3-phosphate dehydrogenase